MLDNLPSLHALKVFLAVSKSSSLTEASKTLNLTRSAVSKQIIALEEELGTILFQRTSKGLQLTELGTAYADNLRNSFQDIERSTMTLRETMNKEKSFRINLLPSFSFQLMTIIHQFQANYPSTNFYFTTGDGTIEESEVGKYDCFIRCYNKDRIPSLFDLEFYPFMKENIVLVCSPFIFANANVKQEDLNFQNLKQFNLLYHYTRENLWKRLFEFEDVEYEHHHALQFEHFFMIVEAAKRGVGFALIPDFLIRGELDRGELIAPLETKFDPGYSFYINYSKQANRKIITTFREFLETKFGFAEENNPQITTPSQDYAL